jgi:hypothetical protein
MFVLRSFFVGLSGLAVLAACATPQRLSTGSITIQIDGPERIEGRRAYVTRTISNMGSVPVCFMNDTSLEGVPGGFTDVLTEQSYVFRGEIVFAMTKDGRMVPAGAYGEKQRIEPGDSLTVSGFVTAIDEFLLRDSTGELKEYRRGDVVVFGTGFAFFPCVYDNLMDAGENNLIVRGQSRPFAFN